MPENQTPRRGPAHGVDPARPLTLTVEGETLPALAGDTVASALLAAGRLAVAPSIYLARPRGLMAAGLEETNALITVHDRREDGVDESMLPATAVEAVDGLEASLLSGLGTLDPREDHAYYDHKHVHADVLVVGAGPAGLAAAREAGAVEASHVLLRLPHELDARLTEYATGADSTPSDVLRQAVVEYMDRHPLGA